MEALEGAGLYCGARDAHDGNAEEEETLMGITRIAWTDFSFNPWKGCMKVSDGCKHCYAETLIVGRFKQPLWGPATTTRRDRTGEKNWRKPLQWNREAARLGRASRVFCASLSDVFEPHPMVAPWREELWALIRATPHLHWQLLTKRPEEIAGMLPADWENGYPNVWLGCSIENNDTVARADHLRQIPAAVRFISYEPALGPLTMLDLSGIDWLIYGGESGHGRRPDRYEWATSIERACHRHGVAFFMKQVSAPTPDVRPGDCTLPRSFPIPRAVQRTGV